MDIYHDITGTTPAADKFCDFYRKEIMHRMQQINAMVEHAVNRQQVDALRDLHLLTGEILANYAHD